MALKADPVARAVDEQCTQTSGFHDFARSPIDGLAGDARTGEPHCSQLSIVQHRVTLCEQVVGLAELRYPSGIMPPISTTTQSPSPMMRSDTS